MNRFRWVALCIAGAAILSFTRFPYAATMQTRIDYASALDRVYIVYRTALAKCTPLAGHDRNMCVVEAHALESRSKAEAELGYKGTIQAKADNLIANADADLMIAKVACDTKAGKEKSTCVTEAKATNFKLVADATERYAK
jgi:hyperosmotically inducible periplasmic protein